MRNIPSKQPERLNALRQSRYFAPYRDDILDQIASMMDKQSFEDDEVLFWEGEPATGLYILEQGSVKLFKLSPQGRELIVRIFEEGTTFNEVPVFDGQPNPVNVAAMGECIVWRIPSQPLRELFHDHPEMLQAVVNNLCSNLRNLVKMVEELSFCQVTQRLARLIDELPADKLDGEPAQRLTQDQMAARLGTVREVVGRSLRELERSGAIEVERGRIRVLDGTILHSWTGN